MPKILVINPNSSEAITRNLDESFDGIRRLADVEIECVTIAASPPGIETQADIESASQRFAALVARSDADAFVSACFSDPGVYLARELTTRPVIGIADSAFRYALYLGQSFGIISILDQSVPRHLRAVRQQGLAPWLANDRAINVHMADLDGAEVIDRVVAVGETLRDTDGAQSVILGCAGMAKYRAEAERRLGIPVIDPTQAAVTRLISMMMQSHTQLP
jgi:Asp/Glu/hydantoin racemase